VAKKVFGETEVYSLLDSLGQKRTAEEDAGWSMMIADAGPQAVGKAITDYIQGQKYDGRHVRPSHVIREVRAARAHELMEQRGKEKRGAGARGCYWHELSQEDRDFWIEFGMSYRELLTRWGKISHEDWLELKATVDAKFPPWELRKHKSPSTGEYWTRPVEAV